MTNHRSYSQDNMPVVSSKSFSQLVTQSTRHMWRVGHVTSWLAAATFSNVLADREFPAGSCVIRVSNTGRLFSHAAVTAFDDFTFTFQSIERVFLPVAVKYDLWSWATTWPEQNQDDRQMDTGLRWLDTALTFASCGKNDALKRVSTRLYPWTAELLIRLWVQLIFHG